MNAAMVADLAAFERGEMSRAEVVSRHGVEALPALAAHDRLREAANATGFDVDAGWSRLEARIAPVAPVVALPPRRRRPRSVVLAAAAAVMLAGSAFAAIGPRLLDDGGPIVPAVRERDDQGAGATKGDGGGARNGDGGRGQDGGRDGGRQGGGQGAADGDSTDDAPTGGGGTGGEGTSGAGTSGGGTQEQPEDPNDRDQGTGNDGHHDDQGGGNDGQEGGGSSKGPKGSGGSGASSEKDTVKPTA